MSRFVDGRSGQRYNLADGEDWVEFRADLSYAERRRIQTGALRGEVNRETNDLDVDVDFAAFEVARLRGWIVNWSFTQDDDKVVPVTQTWIERLDEKTFNELVDLLDRHVEQIGSDEGKEPSGEA